MKTKLIALLSVGIVPCFAGCVSNPLALAPVGPDLVSRAAPGADGYLKVFTATQTVDVDFEAYFNPHLGYEIDDQAGKCVKYVANHASEMDETPDTVSLPPGNYKIVAESTWCGLVTMPVAIQRGQTTTIHLDGRWWHPSHSANAGQLVYLPNGEAVGWSSLASNSSP
jgi:hypothetical protein